METKPVSKQIHMPSSEDDDDDDRSMVETVLQLQPVYFLANKFKPVPAAMLDDEDGCNQRLYKIGCHPTYIQQLYSAECRFLEQIESHEYVRITLEKLQPLGKTLDEETTYEELVECTEENEKRMDDRDKFAVDVISRAFINRLDWVFRISRYVETVYDHVQNDQRKKEMVDFVLLEMNNFLFSLPMLDQTFMRFQYMRELMGQRKDHFLDCIGYVEMEEEGTEKPVDVPEVDQPTPSMTSPVTGTKRAPEDITTNVVTGSASHESKMEEVDDHTTRVKVVRRSQP